MNPELKYLINIIKFSEGNRLLKLRFLYSGVFLMALGAIFIVIIDIGGLRNEPSSIVLLAVGGIFFGGGVIQAKHAANFQRLLRHINIDSVRNRVQELEGE